MIHISAYSLAGILVAFFVLVLNSCLSNASDAIAYVKSYLFEILYFI